MRGEEGWRGKGGGDPGTPGRENEVDQSRDEWRSGLKTGEERGPRKEKKERNRGR